MSYLNPNVVGDFVVFDKDECKTQGTALHDKYVNNQPFPHVVIDDFLPTAMLKRVLTEFPAREQGRFADAQSNLKAGYQLEKIKSAYISNLLYALNSAQMLAFIEAMTGIEGLIPDPYYVGGGLHETSRGGHLSVHADFNVNERLKLIRRLNLIIYLNDEWRDEYGGHLELWDQQMTAAQHRISPVIGRAVVFNTDQYSYHGHPEPLNTPEGMRRRSIALYYYTSPTKGLETVVSRTTQFKVRPGTADRRPYANMMREQLRDLCPPLLWRMVARGRS